MEQIKEGKENAFPHIELDTYSGKPCNQHFGLTKRELFAAMAMQGCMSNEKMVIASMSALNTKDTCMSIAKYAVLFADALINELNKEYPCQQ